MQVFRNKVLRIITKLPKVTSAYFWNYKTGMEKIYIHARKLAQKLYFKSQFSDSSR
jgi:hypothetical protein